MVIKLNKEIEVYIIKSELTIPKDLQCQIKEFWTNQIKDNSHLFNGEIWSVTTFEEYANKIEIGIQKTNYAHYIYDERIGIDGKYGCYNLYCGILLETNDGYYIVGEMGKNTSYPRGLQISGGNLDQNDINSDGKVDIVSNISRELKEELGIDLFDKTIVEKYCMKYMEKPEGRRHSYAPMMKGILSITRKQMETLYSNYKEKLEKSGEDIEFEKLHFIPKDRAIEILQTLDNPKRPYLENLIILDSQITKEIER